LKSNFYVFIISLILLSILSCSQESKPEFFTFQFDKPATLIVKPINNGKNDSISGWYAPFLSPDYMNNYKTIEKVSKNENGEYVLNYYISSPSEVFLSVNNISRLPIFLIPGDSLFVSIDLSDSSDLLENIRFDGKSSSINNYKIYRRALLKESFWDKCSNLVRAKLPIMKLQHAIDSITIEEMDFFDSYNLKENLPAWYINYQRSEIIYGAAFHKAYNINSWKWDNIGKSITANGYIFVDNIVINNDDALISSKYYYFLWQYFERFLSDTIFKMEISERKQIIAPRLLEISDSLLSGEVKDVFNTFIISKFVIETGMYQTAKENIIKQKFEKKDLKYVDYLEKFLNDKLTLKAGAKAPYFYLMNNKKDFVALSDFKGSVLLLNFWFPGCKGCLMEIPYEAKLVKKFESKNFNLVNICFFSSEDNWLKAIKKIDMKGVNLFANDNWEKKLINTYKISSYPHYTLIDKEGNIYSNYPKRPSDGVSEKILDLLAK